MESSVRYEKLKSVCDDNITSEDDGGGTEEKEEDEVIVCLYSPSVRRRINQKENETWVHILVAIVFLTLTLCFVFYKLNYGTFQPDDDDDDDHHHHLNIGDDSWNSTLKDVFEEQEHIDPSESIAEGHLPPKERRR
ncbi:hypothetical protein HHUSO_G1927 [Huso huso]|uniref:Transmembrane protein n=1 Tax=Huso huso TaxID=61971 RepID=A0ABR1A648_HUSHU